MTDSRSEVGRGVTERREVMRTPPSDRGFVLMTSLYNETDPIRILEYLECLSRNLWNHAIAEVVVFYDTSGDDGPCRILEFLDTVAVRVERIDSRPTFGTFFGYANERYPGRRIIVGNGDIYFDASLALLDDYDLSGKFLCLSRWDILTTGQVQFTAWDFSQDVWIFETPLREFPAEIPVGVLGCDESIAWAAEHSGLTVANPSRSVKAYHMHVSGVRSPSRDVRIQAAYKQTSPSELWPAIRPGGGGTILLPAFAALIHGRILRYEIPGRNLGFWIDQKDWASWQFRVDRPGVMTLELIYAADRDSGGSRFVVVVSGQEIEGVVRETGTWARYEKNVLGTVTLPGGVHELAVRAISKPGLGVMNLRSVSLSPV